MATAVRYNGPHTQVTVRGSDGVLYTCGRGQQVTVPDDTAAALFAEGWTAPDGSTPGYTPPISHVIEDVFLDNGVLSKQGSGASTPVYSAAITARLGVDPTNAPHLADPTGATDATAALRSATAAARLLGTHVSPPPGTYTVSDRIHDNAVTSQSIRYVAAIPGTVTIQRSVAQCIIEAAGSKTATVALAADAAVGDTSITVNALPASGLNAEDHIELSSNVIASGNAVVAEIARVQSVTGTGPYTINVYGVFEEAYAVANAAAIARVDYGAVGSYVHGITFRQTAQNRDDAQYPLIRLSYCRDAQIEKCTFRDADVPGIEFKGVLSTDIDRCRFENLTDNLGAGFIGYGVNVGGNCRDIRITRPIGRRVRHVVTSSWGTGDVGGPRHVIVANGQGWETTAGAWNTHKEGKYWHFIACESHNDQTGQGFYIRCPHTTLTEPVCTTQGKAGANAAAIIFAEGQSTDGRINGGRVVMGRQGWFGVEFDSARCTAIGTEVFGAGAAAVTQKSNFQITVSDSSLIDVRSEDPSTSTHITYASGAGTGHTVSGGVFNSSSGTKAIVNTIGSAAGSVIVRGVSGKNLFALNNQSAGMVSDNQTLVKSVSANYTINDLDGTVLVDATGAARNITLPAAGSVVNRTFVVKKKDASANAVTIVGTVDGAVNPTLAAQYNSIRVFSDGTSWYQA